MRYLENRQRLKELLCAIQKVAGKVSRQEIASLVLLIETEHFRAHGKSYTGLYFVNVRPVPEVAFLEETLQEPGGVEPSEELVAFVEKVLRANQGKDLLSWAQSLPAVRHIEEGEPLYVAELCIEEETKYLLFVQKLEEQEEDIPEALKTLARLGVI